MQFISSKNYYGNGTYAVSKLILSKKWAYCINDLDTPNMVVIQIDPETGAITSYQSAIFEEYSAISTPSIEKEKVIQIAKDHVNLTPSKS
ncbi:MAG: hypothetical protein ACOY35_08715 [Bacillota bacterium]